MSDLRVYVKDRDGIEYSFVIHYGMGCRLVSAINEGTEDFNSLLKSVYEFDRGIYDIMECEDNEENYRRELEFAKRRGFRYVAFKPKPSREPVDAGIIETYFSEKNLEDLLRRQSQDLKLKKTAN